jgi:predicted alpha/beta hydrolase
MSRGAQQSTRNMIDQQLGVQNQLLQQSSAQGNQDRSLLMPTIQNLLTSPGYTPAQQSAITQEGMGAARTAYDALNEAAQNRVARTNNAAGYNELTAQLGRQEASNLAQQARQNQIAFGNEAINQQMAGLNALGQTYGIDTNLLGRAMGVPAQLLGARAAASGGSTLSGLGGLFGGLGNLGSLFY